MKICLVQIAEYDLWCNKQKLMFVAKIFCSISCKKDLDTISNFLFLMTWLNYYSDSHYFHIQLFLKRMLKQLIFSLCVNVIHLFTGFQLDLYR